MNEAIAGSGAFFLVGLFAFISIPAWAQVRRIRSSHPQWHEFWRFCITAAGAMFIIAPLSWFVDFSGGGQTLVVWAGGGLIMGAVCWNLLFVWLLD